MPPPRTFGFSGQDLADCAFCPSGGRQFRTTRTCAGCGRALCLACRPWVPGAPSLCPECGGGARANALRDPRAAIRMLEEAGHAAPFWLLVLEERVTPAVDAEELIVPE